MNARWLRIVVKHDAKPIYYFHIDKIDVTKDSVTFAKVIHHVKMGHLPDKQLMINEERHKYALK